MSNFSETGKRIDESDGESSSCNDEWDILSLLAQSVQSSKPVPQVATQAQTNSALLVSGSETTSDSDNGESNTGAAHQHTSAEGQQATVKPTPAQQSEHSAFDDGGGAKDEQRQRGPASSRLGQSNWRP
eukprot:6210985-Pleurochrysis_carterae.AAC.1